MADVTFIAFNHKTQKIDTIQATIPNNLMPNFPTNVDDMLGEQREEWFQDYVAERFPDRDCSLIGTFQGLHTIR